jgi:sortase A
VRRFARILGTLLIIAGAATLVWTVVVWRWQDPFTSLYTLYKQRQLSKNYERTAARYRPAHIQAGVSIAVLRRELRQEARRYRINSSRGEAIGKLEVSRLGLDHMVLVNGTDHDTLKKGPGRDLRTFMPGEGQLVYIAGHRTTYLAPFSHIDKLRPRDRVTVELPYATFRYEITGHRIVKATDVGVLRSRGREQLVLQACHPRFFATHRYLAYGRLVRVTPRGGRAYSLLDTGSRAALGNYAKRR